MVAQYWEKTYPLLDIYCRFNYIVRSEVERKIIIACDQGNVDRLLRVARFAADYVDLYERLLENAIRELKAQELAEIKGKGVTVNGVFEKA
jgi:hypothetical protein